MLMEACQPEGALPKYVLTSGPRKSGKTLGCLHVICQRAWDTPYGAIAMLGPTTSFATDSGCWNDLSKVMQLWIEADFGMKWIEEPRISGSTKRPYFVVNNRWGHDVKVEMHSLQHEKEVEDRFKNKRFTLIYAAELSHFKQRRTYDIWKETLRQLTPQGKGLPSQYHLFLGDTNPADEGEESWIYKEWYTMRTATTIPEEWREKMSDGDFRSLQWQLRLIEIMVEDNPHLEPEELARLRTSYAHDKDLYDRYLLGRWVKASSAAVFSENFRPNFHIRGKKPDALNPNPPMMVPETGCTGLITGWDPGPMNSSVHILEEFMMKIGEQIMPAYKVLDEVVFIGTDGKAVLGDVVESVMNRMAFWESIIKRDRSPNAEDYPVRWKHWSDTSAFDQSQYVTARSVAMEVALISQRKINLMAVQKGHGSIQASVDLIQRLLHQGRLFINNARCPKTIEMFQCLPKGKGDIAVSRTSQHKHVLDSLRYPIMMSLANELQRAVSNVRTSDVKAEAFVTPL